MGGIGKRLINQKGKAFQPTNPHSFPDKLISHFRSAKQISTNLLCVCELMNAEARLFIREAQVQVQDKVWCGGKG